MPEPKVRLREALQKEAQAAGHGCQGGHRCQQDRLRGQVRRANNDNYKTHKERDVGDIGLNHLIFAFLFARYGVLCAVQT